MFPKNKDKIMDKFYFTACLEEFSSKGQRRPLTPQNDEFYIFEFVRAVENVVAPYNHMDAFEPCTHRGIYDHQDLNNDWWYLTEDNDQFVLAYTPIRNDTKIIEGRWMLMRNTTNRKPLLMQAIRFILYSQDVIIPESGDIGLVQEPDVDDTIWQTKSNLVEYIV